jgi:tripartite-type tricarboxylate transporter receptor subunit TctC
LNYASQGVGSGGHILGEMLRLNSGAPFTHVPYRGAGPAVSDLAAGNVDIGSIQTSLGGRKVKARWIN